MNIRFAEPCRDGHLELKDAESDIFRMSNDKPPAHLCQNDIFLGFFFDGTNNNSIDLHWGNFVAGMPLSIDFLGIFDTVAAQ